MGLECQIELDDDYIRSIGEQWTWFKARS
jgi:hypothetical protein